MPLKFHPIVLDSHRNAMCFNDLSADFGEKRLSRKTKTAF